MIRMGLRIALPLLGVAVTMLAGCSEKLETGYDPRRLGASTEVRRGFYAAPFSPEARKAREYEQDFGGGVPPGTRQPGY